ncbi:hypothetical protein [Rhodoferax sp. GW822-FHT02A01]|uniref:hypothetical protein n=1 Tax=Rhodoferax sp. GW822-FHT02A01 TaxID=3141537 RepID=UPI00315D0645
MITIRKPMEINRSALPGARRMWKRFVVRCCLRKNAWSMLRALLGPALTLALSQVLAPVAHAADGAQAWHFAVNGPETPGDQRYRYHWSVLKAALEATRPTFGNYSVTMAEHMTEARQIAEMKETRGQINTMVLDSTTELERDLIAVKIPVDKGLVGYRVFLIRAEDQPRYSAVRTLDDLRQFSMGQGKDWSDVAIYKTAGFKVERGVSYEGLFEMLMNKRFDAFGRGATEVMDEFQARQKRYPGMAIEKDLLLYYPMPVYFWFPRTETGRLHANRVETGMNAIVRNGTLDRLFKQNFAPLIKALNLQNRRLFRLTNPDLPPDQPFSNAQLWFDPLP